jgi:hypothetical protein
MIESLILRNEKEIKVTLLESLAEISVAVKMHSRLICVINSFTHFVLAMLFAKLVLTTHCIIVQQKSFSSTLMGHTTIVIYKTLSSIRVNSSNSTFHNTVTMVNKLPHAVSSTRTDARVSSRNVTIVAVWFEIRDSHSDKDNNVGILRLVVPTNMSEWRDNPKQHRKKMDVSTTFSNTYQQEI